MTTSSTRSTRRLRVLASLQAALLVASLGVPLSALAALTAEGATVNGGSSTTVAPAATMTATVTGKITANNPDWRSTGWRIATTPGAITACADTPDQVGSGPSATVSFPITAPASVGTNNAYFTLYSDNTCSTPAASSWTLPNAVVVAVAMVNTTTAITSDSPDPSTVGSSYTVDVSVTRASGSATITGTVTVSDGAASCTDTTPSGGAAATVTYSCDLTSTTAGAKTLTASYPGNAALNPSSGTAGHTASVATSTTVITCPASVVSTGSAQEPCTVSVTGAGGLNLTPNAVYTLNTAVGTATATYAYAGDANHSGSSDTETFQITPASSTTVVSCPASVVYTGSAQEPCTVSVTGAGGLNLSPTPTYTANTAVGTATATYAYAGDANHSGSSDTETFQITATGVVITPGTPPVLTYGDPLPDDPSGGATASVTGTFSFSPVPGTVLDAGDQPVHVTFTPTDGNFATVEYDITVTVVPAPLTVTVDDDSRTYGAANPPFTFGAAVLVNGDTIADLSGSPVFTTTATASSPVGDYPVSVSGLTSSNYAITFADGTLSVTPADAACTVMGYTGTYDGDDHGATGSCTGVNDETLTGLSLGATFTNVPGGTASWSFANTNYTPRSGSVDVVINPAEATCKIKGHKVKFDGDAHGATGSCTGVHHETLMGLDLGDSFTDVPGGTADWSFNHGNYRADSGSVDVEITPASQAIVFPAIPGTTVGAPRFELEATTDSGLPITYQSRSRAVCTVSGAMATIVGVGTCTIEASQAGDGNTAPADPVTRSFVVAAAADTSTPETSTLSPLDVMGGPGPIPPALLLGLLTVGLIAAALMLLGFRARREDSSPSRPGR